MVSLSNYPAKATAHKPVVPANPYAIPTTIPRVIPTAGRNLKTLNEVKGRHFRFLPAVGMTYQDNDIAGSG